MPKRCYSSRHYKTKPAAEPSLQHGLSPIGDTFHLAATGLDSEPSLQPHSPIGESPRPSAATALDSEPSLLLEEAAGRVPDYHLSTPNVFRGRLCGPQTLFMLMNTINETMVSRPTMRAANFSFRDEKGILSDSFEADYVGRTGAFRGGRSPPWWGPVISSTRRAAADKARSRKPAPLGR